MANRFKRKRRDPISILEGPLIVVWKTRVDKGKTIKRLLEKSTQEMMEVWTKVMALERGNNGQRVKKCFRHKKTQDSYVNRALLTERLRKVKWGSCLSYNMACLSQLESLKLLAVKAINSRSPANMEIVVKSPEVEKAGSP